MFEDIKFFPDEAVHEQMQLFKQYPMAQFLFNYSFPDTSTDEIDEIVNHCKSIRDFQSKIIAPAVARLLVESATGLSTSGWEQIDAGQAYLYVSNHRDIVLDTALMNYCLLNQKKIMTASAIGDNLVHNDFLLTFAKLNRNFLVKRSLSPREMLLSSKHLSQYIFELIQKENRSVWIAQREGRAKDGNDETNKGVLKMLTLAKERKSNGVAHLKQLNIVPVSVAYEQDPTDLLKTKELFAKAETGKYEKEAGEDFRSILQGLSGQKKRIHLQVGAPINAELDQILASEESENKQLPLVADLLDKAIQSNYKLWPSNFIAFDLLNGNDYFSSRYSKEEKETFEQRMNKRLAQFSNPKAKQIFLETYANPVKNKLKYVEESAL